MSLAGRIMNNYTQGGLTGLLKKGPRKLCRYFFYATSSAWYELKLGGTINSAATNLDIKTFFLIEDKNELIDWIDKNRNSFPWIFSRNEIEAAVENKHLFVMLKHGDAIIGYLKIGVGSTYIKDFRNTVVFEPGTAFIYDTFILPEYRGMNLAFYALNKAAIYFSEMGFKRILCHIEAWNIPSIKSFEKAGFIQFCTISFVKAASFSFFLDNRFRPFLSLEKKLRIG